MTTARSWPPATPPWRAVPSGIDVLPHRAPGRSADRGRTAGRAARPVRALPRPERSAATRTSAPSRTPSPRRCPAFLARFGGPVIVAGDLNVVEPGHQPRYPVFGGWEYDFYRSFAAAGMTDARPPRDPGHTNHVADDAAGRDVLSWLRAWGIAPAAGPPPAARTRVNIVACDRAGNRTRFSGLRGVDAELEGVDVPLLAASPAVYIDCYEVLGDAPRALLSSLAHGGRGRNAQPRRLAATRLAHSGNTPTPAQRHPDQRQRVRRRRRQEGTQRAGGTGRGRHRRRDGGEATVPSPGLAPARLPQRTRSPSRYCKSRARDPCSPPR